MRVQQWRAYAPENEKAYGDLKKVYELSEKHYKQQGKAIPDISIDQEWNHFIAAISQRDTKVVSMPRRVTPKVWYAVAATVLLLITAGIIMYNVSSTKGDVYFATTNKTQQFPLPDGSTI